MNCNNDRGFTLIELLVVLVLLGLVSSLVALSFSNSMVNLQVKTASQRVAAALRHARSLAAAHNETYVASFEFAGNRLAVFSWTQGTEPSDSEATETQEEARSDASDTQGETLSELKVYDLPEGITLVKPDPDGDELEEGRFAVLFFPNGSSSGGTITLTNNRGRRYTVEVDFVTGVVRLSEGKMAS
jgi:general secretion pathway protein H